MKSPLQSMIRGFRSLTPGQRQFLLVAGSLLALLLLVLHTTRMDQSRPGDKPSNPGRESTSSVAFDGKIDLAKEAMSAAPPTAAMAYGGRHAYLLNPEGTPRITYSAELSVVTKEFGRARSAMEDVLDKHRGYTAKLRMVGQPSGSVISATLRVPATEYRSALAELKSIGDVERDEESADEIAQQHGDLEARLQNAQNNARRLQQLLKDRSGEAGGLTPIEQQLSFLRREIEGREAERRAYDDRAVFSNIYFSMREERIAPVESFGSEIRSAAVAGFSEAFHSFSAILVFCMNYGPSLLLWTAFLFFPARMLWRHYQRAQTLGSSVSA